MVTTYKAAPDIDVLTSNVAIPGFGQVPVNAFVLHGPEPILVDTGTLVDGREFMAVLRTVIDPADIKWIWLTHPDFDHIGSLAQLIAENPNLKVVTTFLAVGIMTLFDPLPMDRVHLVNPGQTVIAGTRTLTAIKPPAFDNPVTTGFFDHKSKALFSSDCFGALLQDVPQKATDLSEEELRSAQLLWATIDSPWLHNVEGSVLESKLDELRRMEPAMVLSSHLPAAPGAITERLLATLASVPTSPPFVGPDQAALEQMLAQMTGSPK
jgi:flavorubredoxin